jgi:hypothetical protein
MIDKAKLQITKNHTKRKATGNPKTAMNYEQPISAEGATQSVPLAEPG